MKKPWCVHRGLELLNLFQRQQLHLFIDPARIAGQASICADHAVAGDDDGNFIMADCAAHSLCGHPGKATLCGQLLCQRTVGRGLTVGDLEQQLPHFFLEGEPMGCSGGVKSGS